MVSHMVRDAATVIVVRDRKSAPSVLMGKRGASAAFMPDKFVFPGGAVDPLDATVPIAAPLNRTCYKRLSEHSSLSPTTIASAAIRELWEETGLVLGKTANWPDPPPAWKGFADQGVIPDPTGLTYVFRAVTPVGETRRFDARFFVLDAQNIRGDIDALSDTDAELSHLQWVPLDKIHTLDLPFITKVVLAEVASLLPVIKPPASVPFIRHADDKGVVERLKAKD